MPPSHSPLDLMHWLDINNGVDRKSIEIVSDGQLDHLQTTSLINPGEKIFSVRDSMVITLDRIFNSNSSVSELLANGKLSEIAILALFLCYEKKTMRDEGGRDSFWRPYIESLDKSRARGNQSVESPLLWSDAELKSLLAGSPLLAAVEERRKGIREEYAQVRLRLWCLISLEV